MCCKFNLAENMGKSNCQTPSKIFSKYGEELIKVRQIKPGYSKVVKFPEKWEKYPTIFCLELIQILIQTAHICQLYNGTILPPNRDTFSILCNWKSTLNPGEATWG